LYALLGEVYGSGCPLAYLLLQSDKDGAPGGKERYLRKVLEHVKNKWKLKPIITLTDKDWSEINALQAVFASSKLQLCYWHALRAVKTRLSILKRRPLFYDVDEAQAEFGDAIDKAFVPAAQLEPGTRVVSVHY
jgi:hypothetical protein